MLEISDKIQFVADIEFDIPPYDQPALMALDEIIESRALGFDDRNLAIVGLAGAGKTKLKEKMQRRAAELLEPTLGPKAVLSIIAPAKATPRNLIGNLLHAAGDAFHTRDTIGGGETRISELLKGRGTAVVFVDEAHHLVFGKTKRGLWDMTEVMKNIAEIAGLCFVFTGLSLLHELRGANSQFRRRLHSIQELEAFDWMSSEGKRNILMLLHAIDKALPFSTLANLDGQEFAFRIYQATSGQPGLIIPFCKRAAFAAIKANHKVLTLQHFDIAYQQTLATKRGKHVNPFSDNLPRDWKPVPPGFWMQSEVPSK